MKMTGWLTPGERNPFTSLRGGWLAPEPVIRGKEGLLILPAIEPRFVGHSGCSLVTKPTELSQLYVPVSYIVYM